MFLSAAMIPAPRFVPALVWDRDCANKGHLESVKLLVGRKAKLELENKEGLTAFVMAARNGKRSVVRFWAAISDEGGS